VHNGLGVSLDCGDAGRFDDAIGDTASKVVRWVPGARCSSTAWRSTNAELSQPAENDSSAAKSLILQCTGQIWQLSSTPLSHSVDDYNNAALWRILCAS